MPAKYAVVINTKYYPSVDYYETFDEANAAWAKAVEYMSDTPCFIHVVEIVSSIIMEEPFTEGGKQNAS